jgi:sarcosine oxidase
VRRAEFLVVGAGLLGLSTAWALARQGREVTVAERATVGHDRSGSKGAARIFRLGYGNPRYVAMADRSEGMWRDLEHETGHQLLQTTGQITFGEQLDQLVQAMDEAHVAYEILADGEAAARFGSLRVAGRAVFEPRSGVLAADACLDALRQAAGVELLEHTVVSDISDDGRQVHVRLGDMKTSVSVVVLCCGPWSPAMLTGLGVSHQLTATLQQVAYLAPIAGREPSLPVFVEWGRPTFYGLPAGPSGWLKIGFHGFGPDVDADQVELAPDGDLLRRLANKTEQLLPDFDPRPVRTERCFYDNSPDEDFVIDRVGRVVIGAGSSGHGFKFGPLLGEALADLATFTPPSLDLSSFRLAR